MSEDPGIWSASWVQFKCGLRVRKSEIIFYTDYHNDGRMIFIRGMKDPLSVHESIEDIDFMLDRSLSEKAIT